MSIAQITRAAVLDAIRHGKTTRGLLGEHFEVLPTFRALSDVLGPLIASGQVVEHDNGALHVNDLFETLPHYSEEDR